MEQNSLSSGMSKLSLNKDLFKQKGGTLGLVILAGLVLLLVFNAPAILAWATAVWKIVLLVVGSAAVIYVVSDPKARLAASTAYMIFIRKILGILVKMDPIAILEDTIKKMYRSIDRLENSMGKLNGVRLKLKDKITEKKEDLHNCLERKKVAIRQGKKDVEVVEDRQSVRLLKLVQDYIELHDSSEKWYNTMSKIADMAKLTVQDAENEVDAQKERYTMVKLSHSAFKSAMSVINGNPDELALYNQAWQYTQEDIMSKLGEMDRVINSAGGLIDKIDVDKEIYKIKGDDLLKKYDELGLDALFDKFEPTPISKIAFPVANMTEGEKTLKETKAKYF
jgi:hypothetical protein